MEQLQPQIQEQEADGKESSASHQENIPIAEAAKTELTLQLVELLKEIRTSQSDGSRTLEKAAEARDQLGKLSVDLIGLSVEYLDLSIFEERVLEEIEELLENGLDGDAAADSLVCFDSPKAYEIRQNILKFHNYNVDITCAVATGLGGLDSKQSWEMRELLIEKGVDRGWLAASLAGVDSPRAWEMRDDLMQKLHVKTFLHYGLAGLDSDRAWKMREQIFANADDDDAGENYRLYAVHLAGLDSDKAWETREDFLQKGVSANLLLHSLAGIDSERAWKMRNKLIEAGGSVRSTLESIVGLNSEEAWDLRRGLSEEYKDDKETIGYVLESLAGIDDPEAWGFREELQKMAKRWDITRALNGRSRNAIAWRAAKGLLPYQMDKPKS